MDAREASSLHLSTSGIKVFVPDLRHCAVERVGISAALAARLSGDASPERSVSLSSGRLVSFGAALAYSLILPPPSGEGECIDREGRVLVADAERQRQCFFNFLVRQWQPLQLAMSGAYADTREVMYVAFTPEAHGPKTGMPALFVKLGYTDHSHSNGSDGLIGYIEKKSDRLQLTNVRGAGVFVFPAPADHRRFDRPGRAAETSLKTALLNSDALLVTPTGHRAEVAAFSASLEYLFLEAAPGAAAGPLAALTAALRNFSGVENLQPRRAAAGAGGGQRRGRKRLVDWAEATETDFDADAVVAVKPSARGYLALRSRAKAQPQAGRSEKRLCRQTV